MPIIHNEGRIIGTNVDCSICRCSFQVQPGDQERLEIICENGTVEIDISCPGCHTRYTTSLNIDGYGEARWKIAPDEHQYNLVERTVDGLDDNGESEEGCAGDEGEEPETPAVDPPVTGELGTDVVPPSRTRRSKAAAGAEAA